MDQLPVLSDCDTDTDHVPLAHARWSDDEYIRPMHGSLHDLLLSSPERRFVERCDVVVMYEGINR